MDPQQWEKVKDLFELGEPMTPAEREDLLAKEPDDVVRKEAARLLKINPLHAFIDQPVMSPEYLDRFTGHAALLSEGEMLGTRYKIEKRIASGGMGDVYSAYDKDLRERIAIKTIRQDIISNPAIVSRFRREISLARRVAHPNVCKVYDLSREKRSSDGRTVDFLTMELVEGETLSQWLKREAPVGFEVARPLLEQICAGLAAAHDAGVVHRDFKGSNVLIVRKPDGSLRAAVTDFGLARSVSPDTGASHESSTGLAGGTPAYMAPEQMEGRTVGPKADLYALGIVMYEMATGTAPHTGDSPLQIAVRRVTEKPQAPRIVNPDIDASWEEAILRCLEYKPEDRPADARAVAELFGRDRPLFTVPRWRMPRWLLPALAGAAAVMVGVWWWTNRPPEHSEEAMRWYRKGTDSMLDGSYSTARSAFEQALKVEPTFGIARARLADTLYELDLVEESGAMIAQAASDDRKEKYLIDSIRFSLRNESKSALERIDTLIRSDGSAGSLLDRARILDRAGQLDHAIAAYRSVLSKDSSIPSALLGLAIQLGLRGKRDEAIRVLNSAEAGYPLSSEGRASVLIERAKYEQKMEKSIATVRQARMMAKGVGSSTLEVRALFAESYYAARSGNASAAETLASEALSIAKSSGQAALAASGLKELAFIPYSQRNYKAAVAAYREALNVAERFNALRRSAELKRLLGDSLARAGDVDRGIKLLREAEAFHESTGDVLGSYTDRLYLADCESMAERHDVAIQKMGDLLRDVQRTQGAEYFAERVRLSLIGSLFVRSRYPEVVDLANLALSKYQSNGERPKEMYVRWILAATLRHLGQTRDARVVLAPALKDPSNPYLDSAREVEVELLADEGRINEAIELAKSRLQALRPDREPGNAWSRSLCSLFALSDNVSQASAWCQPLVPITAETSNVAPHLQVALFRISAARGQWVEAMRIAEKLVDWTSVRNDPEMRFIAHFLVAVAYSEGGSRTPDTGILSRFQKEKRALEATWGVQSVKAMMLLPRHQKYKVPGV